MRKLISHFEEKHGFEAFCPKAVFFDMDGVLYDSMPNHARSWHEAMAHYGLVMPPEGAYQYEGMRGVETIKTLARAQWHEELSDERAAEMYAYKSALFAQCPAAQCMPGAKELMRQMKTAGLTLCVVTGSGQRTLLDRLLADYDGLLEERLIVTAFDVKHGKPSPEPYLAGMRKAGVEPWQSIVVENAPLGVRAAVAARCFTIAVNTGPLPDQVLHDEGADLVFPDFHVFGQQWPSFAEAVHLR